MMAKQFAPNEDWIKRDGGRISTKGAAAAERASAGLGTLTDDEALVALGIDPRVYGASQPKRTAHASRSSADTKGARVYRRDIYRRVVSPSH